MDNIDKYDYVDSDKINWHLVEQFLKASIPNIPNEKMEIEKFKEGYSNLTYLIKFANWEGVLRRPPFGKIPPKAHDMMREYTILQRVNPVYPYAPKPYIYSEAGGIMERVFYVMEKKQGVVIDGALPKQYHKVDNIGEIISESVVKNLQRLHSVDYLASGMDQLGKPEGFVERQVYGWIKRYEASKTADVSEQKELETWFKENIPKQGAISIVHNDFKLNNLVFDAEKIGKINGVLDWELSTVGDPLTDLGSTLAYWGDITDPDIGVSMVTNQPGFYSRREFAEQYARLTNQDLSNVAYFLAFGFYKLAVILQQLYFRYTINEVQDERFSKLNIAVNNLLELANDARMQRII